MMHRWLATVMLTETGRLIIELDDHVSDETIAASRIRQVVLLPGQPPPTIELPAPDVPPDPPAFKSELLKRDPPTRRKARRRR
jgi:hypothetical protein